MRISRVLALAVIAALVASVASQAQPLRVAARGKKTVTLTDRVSKNQFLWTSDAPLEKIKGSAEGVSGVLTIDPQNVASIRGTISASVATMKTGNETRDGHLKGPQWLDAAKFPQITFTISAVSNVKVAGNKATGTASGAFTMHGVTRTISVPFAITYLDQSAATRKRAPGDLVMITADFAVSLKDFKVTGTNGLVGSKVGETIAVTAQLFGATG